MIQTGLEGGGTHTAVHFQDAGKAALPDPMVNGLELGHHIGHKGLTAEAWLHRHHQDHVAQLQVREGGLGRGAGL